MPFSFPKQLVSGPRLNLPMKPFENNFPGCLDVRLWQTNMNENHASSNGEGYVLLGERLSKPCQPMKSPSFTPSVETGRWCLGFNGMLFSVRITAVSFSYSFVFFRRNPLLPVHDDDSRTLLAAVTRGVRHSRGLVQKRPRS